MHVASSRILALRLPRVLVLCLPPSWWPHFICRFIWLGTAWASLQSDPTASPGPGPLFPSPQGPAPCLPYLLQFIGAAMAAICEACRKADAVFPFVKSGFWKAVTTLTAIAQGAREWKGSDAARAHTHTPSHMLTLQHRIVAKHADAATMLFKHRQDAATPSVSKWTCLKLSSSLCQSTADANGQIVRVRACVRSRRV